MPRRLASVGMSPTVSRQVIPPPAVMRHRSMAHATMATCLLRHPMAYDQFEPAHLLTHHSLSRGRIHRNPLRRLHRLRYTHGLRVMGQRLCLALPTQPHPIPSPKLACRPVSTLGRPTDTSMQGQWLRGTKRKEQFCLENNHTVWIQSHILTHLSNILTITGGSSIPLSPSSIDLPLKA